MPNSLDAVTEAGKRACCLDIGFRHNPLPSLVHFNMVNAEYRIYHSFNLKKFSYLENTSVFCAVLLILSYHSKCLIVEVISHKILFCSVIIF